MRLSNKIAIVLVAWLLIATAAIAQNVGPAPPAAGGATQCSGLSDAGPFCSGTNAASLTDTLAAARLPAFTGDVTTSAGSSATTLATAQSGAHTWAATQTFTVAPVFTDASGTRTALGLGALATVTPGTGVATALGINVGTAGSIVTNGGALGTPSNGSAANFTAATSSVLGPVKPDGTTILNTAGAISVAATTISGTSCTPGSSCTVAPIATAKVVNGSFDLTSINGTVQNVTGFGFTPSTCDGYGAVLQPGSVGISITYAAHVDSALGQDVMYGTGITGAYWINGSFFVSNDGAGGQQVATVTAYSSNTVTLTWAKTGSSTGTFFYSLRCFK